MDGDDIHPFLEIYYSQIGTLSFQMRDYVSSEQAYEKLVELKKRIFGPKSKQIIGPLMKLQHISTIVLADEDLSLKRSIEAKEVLDAAISQLDNNLVMNSGNLSQEEVDKVTEEMNNYKKYKMDICFVAHNLYKHQGNYVLALDYCKEHS